MRTSFLSLAMCLCIAGFISSCDNKGGDAEVYFRPTLIESAEGDYVLFACAGDNIDFAYFKSEGASVVGMKRTPIDYSNMVLFTQHKLFESDFSDKIIGLHTTTLGTYSSQNYKYICNNTEWTESHKVYPTSFIAITSAIKGDVTITADKALFGKDAGTNLSAHFNVWSPNNCVLTSNFEDPKIIYNTKDYVPTAVSEYFVKDSYLAFSFAFYLVDKPEEIYDEVTFTITIPTEDQHIYDYYYRLESDPKAQMKIVENVRVASATVKFGQISENTDFETKYMEAHTDAFRSYLNDKFHR